MTMRRRQFLTAAAGAATIPLWRGTARAQAKPVRVGYAISATVPYAVGPASPRRRTTPSGRTRSTRAAGSR